MPKSDVSMQVGPYSQFAKALESPPEEIESILSLLSLAQSGAGLLISMDSGALASELREHNLLPVFTFATGTSMLNLNVLSIINPSDSLIIGIPCDPKADSLDAAKHELLKMVLAL